MAIYWCQGQLMAIIYDTINIIQNILIMNYAWRNFKFG